MTAIREVAAAPNVNLGSWIPVALPWMFWCDTPLQAEHPKHHRARTRSSDAKHTADCPSAAGSHEQSSLSFPSAWHRHMMTGV